MKTTIRLLGAFFLILVGLGIIVFVTQPKIPLTSLAGPASAIYNKFTDSQIEIQGKLFLVPGKWLHLILEDGFFKSYRPDGKKVIVKVSSLETKVQLSPLFRKEIFIDGVSIHGMRFTLYKSKRQNPDALKNKPSPGSLPIRLYQTGEIQLTAVEGSIISPVKSPPVQFKINKLEGSLNSQVSGQFKGNGMLNGITLSAELETGPLNDLYSNMPFFFFAQLQHKDTMVIIDSQLSYLNESFKLESNFNLSGENIDNFSSIFDYKAQQNVPFSFRGKTTLTENDFSLNISALKPIANHIIAKVKANNYRLKNSDIHIEVQGDLLDIDALKKMVGLEKQNITKLSKAPTQKKPEKNNILFPEALLSGNYHFNLYFKQLIIADWEIEDISLNTVMKNGIIAHAPFSATFKNSPVQGSYSLNFNADSPQFAAQLFSKSWNVGGMLDDFDLADNVDMFLENITSDYKTSGRTFAKLIKNLEYCIKSENGKLTLADPNTGTILPIELIYSKITGSPGKKINLELQGKIIDNLFSMKTTIEDLRNRPLAEIKSVSFKQVLNTDKITWNMDGTLPIPYEPIGTIINNQLSVSTISDLESILQVDLPETGPFSMAGSLHITRKGYKLSKIVAKLGSTSIAGDISLTTEVKPPALAIDLQSKFIQLADFMNNPPTEHSTVSQPNQNNETKKEVTRHLIDQTILDKLNATLRIAAKNVFSGKDYLGSGILELTLNNGQFSIAPLHLSLPKGDIDLDFSLEPYNDINLYSLSIAIENLDYGIVGRWFKPESDLGGIINLHSSLQAESSNLKHFMSNASGYIDLSLLPHKMQTGIINLWAVNLFSYLLPFFTPDNESKVNCMAGSFNINDGILTHKEILLDTSKIQVKGTVEVDFTKRWIDLRLRPIPKRPQFYSLATPIQVSGKLEDINVSIAKGGLLGTMIRLITSYIVVPLQWVILEKLPVDNTKECLQIVKKRMPLPNRYESNKTQ